VDEAWGTGAFDFAAEGGDVDGDDVGFEGGVHVVDVLPEIFLGDKAVGVVGEVIEEGEFAGGEIDGVAGAFDFAGDGIDGEIVDLEEGRDIVFSAEQGADAGEELIKIEGFDEVIIGAAIEAADAVLAGVAGGEDEDTGGGFAFAEGAEDVHAVDAGEHEVEKDDIVFARESKAEAVWAVGGGVDGVTGFGEAFAKGFSQGGGIFDDEESHGGFFSCGRVGSPGGARRPDARDVESISVFVFALFLLVVIVIVFFFMFAVAGGGVFARVIVVFGLR
jgi:hypothetical protein